MTQYIGKLIIKNIFTLKLLNYYFLYLWKTIEMRVHLISKKHRQNLSSSYLYYFLQNTFIIINIIFQTHNVKAPMKPIK